MSKNKSKSSVPVWLVVILSLAMGIITFFATEYFKAKALYKSEYPIYSQELIKSLGKDSSEMKKISFFYNSEQLKSIFEETVVSNDDIEEVVTKDGIEVIDIKGSTYQGKLMIVHRPEDVIVAVNPTLDSSGAGKSIEEYVKMHKGIAGINAGGFEDSGGTGNGGQAWGIVISDGKLISGKPSDFSSVIGINYDNKLVVGDMSAQQALEWNIRDAVTFGPIFIDKFKVVFEKGRHPNLNPRTVIGQRSDGSFLLLVLDGRQPVSFGSTYEDVIDIMKQYYAMTAANLDGGNSTIMTYNGETINSPVSIYGARSLPTAFVVKGK